MLYIGYHVSIGNGVLPALQEVKKIGGNCCQIFTGPPQSLHLGKIFHYNEKEYEEIKNQNFPIFIHAKYLLNFAKPLLPKNKIFLVRYTQDLDLSVKIGSKGVVLHFGTASNGLSKEEGKKNMIASLMQVLEHCDKNANIILETSSGEGNYLGRTIEGMNEIYKGLPKKYQKRITFCIDTCHIFVAGYDIRKGWIKYIKEFEKKIGKNKIALVHLNDSATPFNGKNDRHQVLGEGYIFNEKLGGNPEIVKEIIDWANKTSIPLILETHKEFKKQILYIKSFMDKKGGENKISKKIIDEFRQLTDFHKALGNIHQYQVYKNLVNKLSKMNSLSLEKIKNIEGVGQGILHKIEEFEKTGKIQVLEEMKKDKKLVLMVKLEKVYGIGPKQAKKFINKGVTTLEDLKKEDLTYAQQLGLLYYKDLNKRIPLEQAKKMGKYIEKKIGKKIYLLGGFRLGKKDGKDLDIVILDGNEKDLEKLNIIGYLDRGINRNTVLMKFPFYKNVVHVDFRYTNKKNLPFFTLYFGSGDNFSRKIRSQAKEKGYTLNEFGLKKNGNYIKNNFKTEEDIFTFLGLEYVKPENRL